MKLTDLRAFYERGADLAAADPHSAEAHEVLLAALESGEARAAEPDGHGGWRVNAWVKTGILAGFRRTAVVEMDGPQPFFDKSAFPPRRFALGDQIRLVPGGTSVRRGAHLGPGVVLMPPAYVNTGAWIGEGAMIDSHALVGSCAQIGTRVHLSAGAQIGGVLEPAGARPVVIGDEAFVGALAGVFEGVIVHSRAVIAAGTLITGSSVIYDLVHGKEHVREVPRGAVVVPGTRPATGAYAKELGISVAAPVIVKYRDARTDAATALEEALR
jgi:2,3,4,5-tetrahydropyridine-2,6-dicarboxylate N-succinyltransferase